MKKHRVFSFILALVMVITIMPFTQFSAAAVSHQESAIQPRYGMTYTETEPRGAEWETTAHISTGDNKLNNMLSSITVGLLASYLASILPISSQAQIVAGAILGGLPSLFADSSTLYYKIYTYSGVKGASSFYNKFSVYIYYDKDRTVLADHVIYYGIKTPGPVF